MQVICSSCTRQTKWDQPLNLIPSSVSTSELVLGKENSLTMRYKKQKVFFCQKQEAPLLDCRVCPEHEDLNLNSCTYLHSGHLLFLSWLQVPSNDVAFTKIPSICILFPERLLLQCPSLVEVHASGCEDMLIGAIRNQVFNEFAAARADWPWPCKRLADGLSKRVLVPYSIPYLTSDEGKKSKRARLR